MSDISLIVNMDDMFFTHFPSRLKDERKRLGLTQAEAADLCGVRREAWGQYERGSNAPGAQVLYAFAEGGADVAYLMTGQRAASEHAQDSLSALTDEQSARLQLAIEAVEEGLEIIGRVLNPERKARLILAAYDLMAEPGEAKSKVVDLIRLVA